MRTLLALAMPMALFAFTAVRATSAGAEDLTIALSTDQIGITSSFTGATVTVFGVVENPAPSETYNVAVRLYGPSQNVVVRRKDQVFGIWINRASQTLLAAPSYYAVRSSAPLEAITDIEELKSLSLGLDNIGFVYRGSVVVNDPSSDEFRQAFLRLKEEAGLYSEAEGVEPIGQSVFRARIELPANIPVGRYTAVAHIFAGGKAIGSAREFLTVNRTGSERALFEFSRNQSLFYGLIGIIAALFVGWLAGIIFRRD